MQKQNWQYSHSTLAIIPKIEIHSQKFEKSFLGYHTRSPDKSRNSENLEKTSRKTMTTLYWSDAISSYVMDATFQSYTMLTGSRFGCKAMIFNLPNSP